LKTGNPFPAEQVAEYGRAARSALSRLSGLLEERRRTGRVRRCHGDLHLNNIFVRDEQPVLFDAIEFNDRFACIDVLYDLAFLLMDLDQDGVRQHANTVFNRYLERSDEHAGLAAMPLFLSCRAAVRAHTAAARAETCKDGDLKLSLLQDATALLDRAIDDLVDRAPRLVAIGGLSGTGKSTLAYALAPFLGARPGAVVIRSDIVRKQLLGVEESTRLPQTAYTPAISKRVYDRVTEIAFSTLASGHAVIADAVYGMKSEREQIADTARQRGAPFNGLWLVGPPRLLEQRIAARRGDASDATPDVLRAQLGFVTAPQAWTNINAASSPAETLAEGRRILGL
jgi:predicted kinase